MVSQVFAERLKVFSDLKLVCGAVKAGAVMVIPPPSERSHMSYVYNEIMLYPVCGVCL